MRYLGWFRRGPKLYRKIIQDVPNCLPSVRTVQRTSSTLDFHVGIMDHIMKAAGEQLKSLSEMFKWCKFAFDEMSLRRLYYLCRAKDKIMGFQDLGKNIPVTKPNQPAAKVLVCMLEGLYAPWKFPMSFYFTDGKLVGETLKTIILENMEAAFKVGFRVRTVACDQAGPNRKALDLLREDRIESNNNQENSNKQKQEKKTKFQRKCPYFMFGPDNKIYILYDVPHMVKCVRNNWLGPFEKWMKVMGKQHKCQYPGNNFCVNGWTGRWRYIVLLHYHLEKTGNKDILDKLIFPINRQKMRVTYVMKILSKRITQYLRSKAFHDTLKNMKGFKEGHIDEACETANVVEFMNNLADFTNGPSHRELKSKSSEKSQFLVTENSAHMEEWKNFLEIIKTSKFTQHNGKPTKGQQYTLESYHWTLMALIELWPDLQADGFETLNLRHLNQDIVENFFGQVRGGNCGDCDHPTCAGFIDAYSAILISGHSSDAIIEGSNCEPDNIPMLIDHRKLIAILEEKESKQNNEQANTNPNNSNVDSENCVEYPKSPPCFHIPQDDDYGDNAAVVEEELIERIACESSLAVYDLIRDLLKKMKDVKCDECKNSFCKTATDDPDFLDHAQQLFPTIRKSISLFNEHIATHFDMENIFLTTCTLFHEQLDMGWLMCQEHKASQQTSFFERLALLLIERQCVLKNKDDTEIASRAASNKKISQQSSKKTRKTPGIKEKKVESFIEPDLSQEDEFMCNEDWIEEEHLDENLLNQYDDTMGSWTIEYEGDSRDQYDEDRDEDM